MRELLRFFKYLKKYFFVFQKNTFAPKSEFSS